MVYSTNFGPPLVAEVREEAVLHTGTPGRYRCPLFTPSERSQGVLSPTRAEGRKERGNELRASGAT